MPGGHLGSGLDGCLVAVRVRVAVVVETGDGDPQPALAGGTRLKNVGDSAWVDGVDGGSLGDGEVGGGVVVVAATDLSQGDRVVGEGEGVETVGGDLTLGEPEGAVVVDPSGDGGDVFAGVVVTPQRPGEVCRVGVVAGAGETEVGDGGEDGVEHILRVGRSIVVGVLSEAAPGAGDELSGYDGSVPSRVP